MKQEDLQAVLGEAIEPLIAEQRRQNELIDEQRKHANQDPRNASQPHPKLWLFIIGGLIAMGPFLGIATAAMELFGGFIFLIFPIFAISLVLILYGIFQKKRKQKIFGIIGTVILIGISIGLLILRLH